jgi:hypothetical protein
MFGDASLHFQIVSLGCRKEREMRPPLARKI